MLMHLPRMSGSFALTPFLGAGIDRLPFQVCPRFFIISHYAKNVKPKFMLLFARISIGYPQLSSKNRLDKSAKIAYNKSKESTPADGLLPLFMVKKK